MQELLDALLANQLALAMVLNMGIVTVLIRKVTWFGQLGDAGRVVTSLVSSMAIISGIRLLGGEPSADLLAQIPALLAVLIEALVTFAGGATAFHIVKTQPRSEP